MLEGKPILAIETSQSLCGTCVYFDGNKFFEASTHLKNSHAEKLFEMIDYVIKSSQIKVADLGAIAVSAGPGSFTGLRIGMSAAKGIAFGSSLPIIPVPTFEAIALELSSILPNGSEFIIANKVNVEEVYYAKFQIKSNSYIFVEKVRIVNFQEFQNLKKDTLVFGNAELSNASSEGKIKYKLVSPSPVFIAEWGRAFGEDVKTFDYDYLEPNYLKNFIIKERKNA